MEGSGYWVIIALFYLLTMWLKKRRQAERRRQFEASEDGTVEPAPARPAQSDFLSNLLRDAGFDFDKEEEAEVVDVEPDGATYGPAPETIRERMVGFDQEAVDIEPAMAQPDDGRIVKRSTLQRTREYEEKSKDYRRLIPDLDDIDDLREAIILKEILDKPRALRRRIR